MHGQQKDARHLFESVGDTIAWAANFAQQCPGVSKTQPTEHARECQSLTRRVSGRKKLDCGTLGYGYALGVSA